MRGVRLWLNAATALSLLHLSLAGTATLEEEATYADPGASPCEQVRSLDKTVDRCQFVRDNCQSDSLVPYLELFYCYARPAGILAEAFMQVCCGFLLALIFRLLGSTAEDFFSPILTQISQELGLPPRFAGVTLLALGNGAPDLVSSIAFVKAGKYTVAISGLLGGGMFVGAAVAGVVIMTAQGVKARGALLRDVSCYIVAVSTVGIIMRIGRVTWGVTVLLLAMYLLFVAVVLAADIHHIWQARVRGQAEEPRPPERLPLLAGDLATPPQADLPDGHSGMDSATSIELTEGQHSTHPDSDTQDAASQRPQSIYGGRETHSSWSEQGRRLSYEQKVHMSGQVYRQMALAEIAHSETFFGHPDMERSRRLALLDEGDDASGQGDSGYVAPQHPDPDIEASEQCQPETAKRLGEGGSEPAGSSPEPPDSCHARVLQWRAGGHGHEVGRLAGQGLQEPASHSGRSFRFWQGGDTGWGSRGSRMGQAVASVVGRLGSLLGVAEYPFLILRRASIPLVDNDSYERPWFVAAVFGAPIAILWYCEHLTLTFTLPLGLCIGAALTGCAYAFTLPEKPPSWSLGLPFPVGAAIVAAVGFTISAMWIDTIAGELVALLEYLGTLSGIPHEVLGLTVLAWGNSVGDLSTNTAMAKRGFSNMAMTACFAGPIFNLLMALSLGFMRFLTNNHLSSTPVHLGAVDYPSLIMICVNGVMLMAVGLLHNNWVPAWYGAVPLALYALYVGLSLAVAFG